MKKNRMMRLASVLLICVLLTTSVISGTFAKYTTSDTATDTARVAAWGFGDDLTIDFDLFDFTYDDTVAGAENVIAPGTTKTEMVTLTYANTTGKGAPEVDYTIDLNVINKTIGENIKSNKNIQWSFNKSAWGDWDTMVAAIEAYHEDVQANALPAITNTGIEIKWQWIFDETKGGEDLDSLDTAMGNANPLESVNLTIQLVAEQVD